MGASSEDQVEWKETEKILKFLSKKFGSLNFVAIFAIPFAWRMGFFDTIIEKIERKYKQVPRIIWIESVDFFREAVGVGLRFI